MSSASVALAMVRPDHAEVGTELEMAILDARHRVTVIPESPTTRKTSA